MTLRERLELCRTNDHRKLTQLIEKHLSMVAVGMERADEPERRKSTPQPELEMLRDLPGTPPPVFSSSNPPLNSVGKKKTTAKNNDSDSGSLSHLVADSSRVELCIPGCVLWHSRYDTQDQFRVVQRDSEPLLRLDSRMFADHMPDLLFSKFGDD